MSDQSQLDQQIRRALKKIPKIRKIFFLIELWLRVGSYKTYNSRARSEVHWLGSHRPRRPERLFIVVVYAWAIVLLEADQFLIWCIVWGALVAIFVITKSFAMLVPKRKQSWVIRY